MKFSFLIILIFISAKLFAQTTDTIPLNEVVIKSYPGNIPLLYIPATVSINDSNSLHSHSGESLVPVINAVAGVRMEERSPGSYRLSIRGSLLRSPFGIRNVKVYYDEFPFTDGGGNTYLNLIPPSVINKIEIIKGPDGSLFGANSGGVVRLNIFNEDTARSVLYGGINAGSYNMLNSDAAVNFKTKNNVLSIHASQQQTEGYRENSSLKRNFFQVHGVWNYNNRATIKVLLFYSRLQYLTPGGLTLTQYETKPDAARPGTNTLPGAVEQQAGIKNNTLFSGIIHDIKITDNAQHVIAVYGSQTEFKNPFITNYEERDETNLGFRTWFKTRIAPSALNCIWQTGAEGQYLSTEIKNYENNSGEKGELIADGNLKNMQGFLFTRFALKPVRKISAELSASYNYNRMCFSALAPQLLESISRTFNPQVMPRLAVSYVPGTTLSLRAIASKGYSPPALAEIYSSSNFFNTTLQPETGWNYEAGIRFKKENESIWFDIAGFYYELNSAITRQIDINDKEFFVNAGTTHQPGIEAQIFLQLIRSNSASVIKQLSITQSYAYSPFTFANYSNNNINYGGNNITGVPQQVLVTLINFQFFYGWQLIASNYYVSHLPLNDANSAYAKAYNLVSAKISRNVYLKKLILNLSAGANNLINETYSAGNDLNAFGGRYYNAAPLRNYFLSANFYLKS